MPYSLVIIASGFPSFSNVHTGRGAVSEFAHFDPVPQASSGRLERVDVGAVTLAGQFLNKAFGALRGKKARHLDAVRLSYRIIGVQGRIDGILHRLRYGVRLLCHDRRFRKDRRARTATGAGLPVLSSASAAASSSAACGPVPFTTNGATGEAGIGVCAGAAVNTVDSGSGSWVVSIGTLLIL